MAKAEPDLRIYGVAKIGEKGQIVIPANARRELNLSPDDEVIVLGSPSKKFIGVMRERDVRDVITQIRQRFTRGMEMGDKFAAVEQELNDLKK